MIQPFHHNNLLSEFVANPSNEAWAKDLVCLSAKKNGFLESVDYEYVLNEMENHISAPTLTLPVNVNDKYPRIELLKLTHHSGVNALADEQSIIFCNEGMTMITGFNRSGKSGYFRILNQMAVGAVAYPLLQNVHAAAPNSISVSLDYVVDGANNSFIWNGSDPLPDELRHIRFFDSNYAERFLKPRSLDTYLFESIHLRIYQGIFNCLKFMKDLGTVISGQTEAALRSLCSSAYVDSVKLQLVQLFRAELEDLNMGDLKVELLANDLLSPVSEIKLRITNGTDKVHSILSEAELKCAALAMFFAESDLLEVPQPLIFDDPVNSLDAQIIQSFANRIINSGIQTVVFTHNSLLQEMLTDTHKVIIYKKTSVGRPAASAIGLGRQHIIVNDVVISAQSCGFVLDHSDKKTLFYLDEADAELAKTPPIKTKEANDNLREAVEWMIDEVVLNGVTPLRYRGNTPIPWKELKVVNSRGIDLVNKLYNCYNKLSSGGSHLGGVAYAAPLGPAELQIISAELRALYALYPPT